MTEQRTPNPLEDVIAGLREMSETMDRINNNLRASTERMRASMVKMSNTVDTMNESVNGTVNQTVNQTCEPISSSLRDNHGTFERINKNTEGVLEDMRAIRRDIRDMRCDITGVRHEIGGGEDRMDSKTDSIHGKLDKLLDLVQRRQRTKLVEKSNSLRGLGMREFVDDHIATLVNKAMEKKRKAKAKTIEG